MAKKLLHRVHVQVTILVIILVTLSNIVIYALVYTMSYREMVNILEEKANSLVAHIDDNMDATIFTEVKSKEDMTCAAYIEAYNFLNEARSISSTKYLYTAVKNDAGELIYHIDGLPMDDPDFRNVGDLIEPEFQTPLNTALGDEVVLPTDILNTEWGYVYVAYYPLHDSDGNVIAALGIEFSADSQYLAYQSINDRVSIVIFSIMIISGFFARFLFKRISNPYFKDIYNTDSLTKLKNRTAFDLDIHNSIQRHNLDGTVLVATDLNGLKPVNDKLGHIMGDFYIESCAQSLIVEDMEYCIVYRIGGDEFATIIPKEYSQEAENYICAVKSKLTQLCKDSIPAASASMGYSICKGATLKDWEITQKEADEAMYADKRAFYEKNKEFDSRR